MNYDTITLLNFDSAARELATKRPPPAEQPLILQKWGFSFEDLSASELEMLQRLVDDYVEEMDI